MNNIIFISINAVPNNMSNCCHQLVSGTLNTKWIHLVLYQAVVRFTKFDTLRSIAERNRKAWAAQQSNYVSTRRCS